MCWDHGRNVPSWNTSLLPDDQRLDVGSDDRAESGETSPEKVEKRSAHSQVVSAKKKKTASVANVAAAGQEDPLTSLIQVTLLLAPLNIGHDSRNTFIR
jgi:hypothetical protein